MKSILKATAVLGSASVVNIVVGLVSSKISALLLGPIGFGFTSLVLTLLGIAVMLAGMGVTVGLVRAGARALADGDLRQMAALRGAAWLLCGSLGVLMAAAMILARAPLALFMLGGQEHAGAVVIIALALLLNLSAGVQTGILNANQRVSAMVRSSILGSVIGTCFSLLIIWRWREAGIPIAVLATCVVSWGTSFYYVRKLHPRSVVEADRQDVVTAAKELLRFGAPFTASLLVGAGVITLLPVIVLHVLSAEAAGYYRAASAVAVSYLGFVTASLAQDYYPRVSAVADDKETLCRLINDQHRLLLLLGGPAILGMLALVPHLVPIIYSSKFMPAVGLLEWQLLGDIFRLAAWTMAFVILAHSGSMIFFALELGGGTCLTVFSWLGMRWFGLNGLGMAFVASAICYYLLCWIILKKSIGLRWSRSNIMLLVLLILLGSLVRVLPTLGLEQVRTPVALVLASGMGIYSFCTIWREVGGVGEALAFLRRRGRRTAAPRFNEGNVS